MGSTGSPLSPASHHDRHPASLPPSSPGMAGRPRRATPRRRPRRGGWRRHRRPRVAGGEGPRWRGWPGTPWWRGGRLAGARAADGMRARRGSPPPADPGRPSGACREGRSTRAAARGPGRRRARLESVRGRPLSRRLDPLSLAQCAPPNAPQTGCALPLSIHAHPPPARVHPRPAAAPRARKERGERRRRRQRAPPAGQAGVDVFEKVVGVAWWTGWWGGVGRRPNAGTARARARAPTPLSSRLSPAAIPSKSTAADDRSTQENASKTQGR